MGFIVLIGEGYSVIEAPGGFDWVNMIGLYAGIPFYIILYMFYKYYWKTKFVPLMECDLLSGLTPIRDDDIENMEMDDMDIKSRLDEFRRRAKHFFKKT